MILWWKKFLQMVGEIVCMLAPPRRASWVLFYLFFWRKKIWHILQNCCSCTSASLKVIKFSNLRIVLVSPIFFSYLYYDGFLNVEFRYRVTLKIVYLSHKQNIMNKRLFWFLKRIIPLRKWPPLVFFFENVHIFKKHFRVEFKSNTTLEFWTN